MVKTCGFILVDPELERVFVLHPTNHPADFHSIPKGECDPGETELEAAIREFSEETDNDIVLISGGMIAELGEYEYKKGKNKTLVAFGAVCKNYFTNPVVCKSTFNCNGEQIPECDDFEWMPISRAYAKLHPTQSQALKK